MNLAWFSSPEWAHVVKALLHTLWQGAIIAVLLGLVLRRLENPVARYRGTLAGLMAVVISGLVTWAVLNRPVPAPANMAAPAATTADVPTVTSDEPPLVVNFSPIAHTATAPGWTAWLALVWLAGATVMLGRAGFQVAGAERLRRASQPVADARLAELLAEARRAVGLMRQVRLAVTDRLTSPAVVGVLVPTLILPLSLASTLSPEQIRFILLHELAHIRRGDYFANLFQLFAEALLFFNPAVWWLSHQIRIEREACCDALAIELSGAPADYARTLVHVAESVLNPAPAAAAAFGNGRGRSSLADRVQRLLVPGYRPRLRLTWRAMLASLCVGGTLLMVSALGTRVTVAAILSPQQRIERIEKKMAELGESPEVSGFNGDWETMPKVLVSGVVRTADGSPVPKWVQVNINSTINHSSYGTAGMARNGLFTNTVRAGSIMLSAEVTNYAPAVVGPLDGMHTNLFVNEEIILERGFDVPLRVVDADSGQPLADATIQTMFWENNNGFQAHFWKSGVNGAVTLTHCADLPLDVTVNAPGYEILKKRFEGVKNGGSLEVRVQRGVITSGTVVDKATGEPVAGAKLQLLYQMSGDRAENFGWNDVLHILGTSDGKGTFTVDQLHSGWRYYIGVTAPGHGSVIVPKVLAGTKDLTVKLGPELVVHGHVKGDLNRLQQIIKGPGLNLSTTEVYENSSTGNNEWVPVRAAADGTVTFQFTNRMAGQVTLNGEAREITGPVADWVVDLAAVKVVEPENLPKREVIFRFQHPSDVSPRGVVAVTVPDSLKIDHLTVHEQEMEMTNSEVRVPIAIGGRTSVEPKRMVGYWFDRGGPDGAWYSILVTNGPGPMVIEVPLVPAGAIYAHAKNVDGTLAGSLMFGVTELKRAPGRNAGTPLDNGGDGFSSDAPRRWVSGPLPLGGKYQIHAWRGNTFAISEPIKLTEANPDAEVELQFAPGKSFTGVIQDADGKPLRDVEVRPSFTLDSSGAFGLKSVYTDAQGQFQLTDATPDLGEYTVEVSPAGFRAERVRLNFNAPPQTIRLQHGRTLAGRVIDSVSGQPIPGMEVRALDYSRNKYPMLTTHTDDDGHFEFTMLGDTDYTLYPDGGELLDRPTYGNKTFHADGSTNLVLRVKLYAWSNLKPKPAGTSGGTGQPQFQTRLQAVIHRDNSGSTSADFAPADNAGYGHAVARQSAEGVDTNGPSVLVSAYFYEAKAGVVSEITGVKEFQASPDGSGSWAEVPAENVSSVRDQMKASGTLRAAPRILSFSGQHAQFSMGGQTNKFILNCTPWVTNGQVELDLSDQTSETLANHPETSQFVGRLVMKNSGAMLLSLNSLSGVASNKVVLLDARIITNRATQFQQRLQNIIKRAPMTNAAAEPMYTPQHQKILAQLRAIRLAQFVPFEGETLENMVQRLSKAIREQSTNSEGISFLITGPDTNHPALLDPSTGLPVQQTATPIDARLALVHLNTPMENLTVEDILYRVVTTAVPPVKYSIMDYGVVFSPKEPGESAPSSAQTDNTAATSPDSVQTRTFKLENSMKSDKLKEAMVAAGVTMPPTVYQYFDNGMLVARGTADQLALVNQAVLALNGFTNTTLVERVRATVIATAGEANQLFTRTYKVDKRRFLYGLKQAGFTTSYTNDQEMAPAMRQLFSQFGVDMDTPPGKAVFFNDGSEMLLVRATAADLDNIDKIIVALNQPPPQVHIKARFIEVPKAGFVDPAMQSAGTNAHLVGILSWTNAEVMLQMLKKIKGAKSLGEPEVVTLSGRQARMMMGDVVTIVTNMNFSEGPVAMVTTNLHMHKPPTYTTNVTMVGAFSPGLSKLELGITFDATPKVLADGFTLKLPMVASHKQFWGYAQVPKHYPMLAVTNSEGQVLNPPRFWPVVSDSKAATELTLRDNQTVVMALPEPTLDHYEEPEKTHDAVAAKLYQTERAKKGDMEILVLVTPTIVDPAGNRVHSDDESWAFPIKASPEDMRASKGF